MALTLCTLMVLAFITTRIYVSCYQRKIVCTTVPGNLGTAQCHNLQQGFISWILRVSCGVGGVCPLRLQNAINPRRQCHIHLGRMNIISFCFTRNLSLFLSLSHPLAPPHTSRAAPSLPSLPLTSRQYTTSLPSFCFSD